MGDQVELVNILETEDFQSVDNIKTNVWNQKLAKIHKAVRKKDKLILLFIVVQLICISLTVAYLNAYIEKFARLETQIQELTFNASKITSVDRLVQISSPLGTQCNAGDKGEKGERGDYGLRGLTGVSGDKGEIGDKGSSGAKGQIGDKGPFGEKGPTGMKGQNGEKGLTGERGPIGDKGLKGIHGEKGINGDKGAIGNEGPSGDNGQKGARGEDGEKGSPGESVQVKSCDAGWEQFKQSCYYIEIRSTKTWNEAKMDCRIKGSRLVKIDNAFENSFLKSFAKDRNARHVWIGAHVSMGEPHFVWEADNTDVTFTDWAAHQPDNSRNAEDCVHLDYGLSNTWNDNSCSKRLGYICEKQYLLKMSEQVQLVNILQADEWNKSELQRRDSIETNAWNDKLAEIRNASKKRDRAFLALTIMLLICFSLAVTVVVIYLEEYIEKSSELEKQIHHLNTSGWERKSHLSNQLGSSDHGNFPKGKKGSRGEMGPVGHKDTAGDRGQQGKKGETGNKGSAGSKGQLGDVGPIGGKGQNGTKGSKGEKGMSGEKGLLGEKGAVGANGSAGDKGTIGDEGPSGQKGEVGEKGALGAKGHNGNKGVDGEMGRPGEMGQTGLVGPTERKGSISEKGPTGDKGPKGEIGLAGQKGEKGIRGDKGLVGNMGPVGDKGQIGARGQNDEKGNPGESVKTINCGSGWEQFMRSCYHFQFKSKMTWNAAKTDCHRKGGFLVKIDNTVENWFLKSFIIVAKNPGHVWIGAHDSVQESRFIWESDNTVLTYTDWNPGEPNNAGEEDCVHMSSALTYKWNDIQCSHKFSFICEKH
ncbi:uncharacterized protein LOC127722298 [Mytilus californianus]|uniref:uncharacterized protein LOC127722298 n=1 Tax=Mytilus californianus TaxID=6549 RepID=UPI00224503E8|nr:uncharacterized protein LOC127722298 [Mytilus californianus]